MPGGVRTSPLAGQPAPTTMLVDLARLERVLRGSAGSGGRGRGIDARRRADRRQADPGPGKQRPHLRSEGRRRWRVENLYKIHAESFRDQAHLDVLLGEAQGSLTRRWQALGSA